MHAYSVRHVAMLKKQNKTKTKTKTKNKQTNKKTPNLQNLRKQNSGLSFSSGRHSPYPSEDTVGMAFYPSGGVNLSFMAELWLII